MISEKAVIDKYLYKIDRNLLRCAFDKKLTSEEAAEFTSGIVTDEENSYILMQLSKIGTRDGFDGFRQDMVPRLRGMYRLSLVRRAANRNRFKELLKLMSDAGIDCILGYYLSFLMYYAPDDILTSDTIFDIIVHGEDLERAQRLVSSAAAQYFAQERAGHGDIPSSYDSDGTKHSFFIGIKADDGEYIWNHVLVSDVEGYRLNIPDRVSMLLIGGRYIYSSLKNDDMYCNAVLFDRMRWLYEYQVLNPGADRGGNSGYVAPADGNGGSEEQESADRGIDMEVLLREAGDELYPCLRFILRYAGVCCGDDRPKRFVRYSPGLLCRYQKMLESMYRG